MGLNRTFMELKLESPVKLLFSTVCLNRTFMELKYENWSLKVGE